MKIVMYICIYWCPQKPINFLSTETNNCSVFLHYLDVTGFISSRSLSTEYGNSDNTGEDSVSLIFEVLNYALRSCLLYLPFHFPSGTPIMKTQVSPDHSKALSVLWGPLDEYVLTGHEDGSIIKWDMRTGKEVSNLSSHCLPFHNFDGH